jgi:hypothetical protein
MSGMGNISAPAANAAHQGGGDQHLGRGAGPDLRLEQTAYIQLEADGEQQQGDAKISY